MLPEQRSVEFIIRLLDTLFTSLLIPFPAELLRALHVVLQMLGSHLSSPFRDTPGFAGF
jgi:hypothetical protein